MTEDELLGNDPEHGIYFGHYKGIHLSELARDLLLFGSSRVVEVCDAYNLSAEVFKEISELPAFKKELRELRSVIETSPNALIQVKARTIVERGLEELQQIVVQGARDADRIKAMELLYKIAVSGMLEGKEESSNGRPQASGLVLNVNLGPNGSLIPPKRLNANMPLRSVEEVQQEIMNGK